MARSPKSRLGISILTLSLAVALTPLTAIRSHATTTSIQQHWDLLAETVDNLLVTTELTIERGYLPGGSSALSPAPSVSFEVVGKHAGGTGTASWRVSLLIGQEGQTPTAVAPVVFSVGESSFQVKHQSFSWPSTDRFIRGIKFEKLGLTAGSLSVKKAYLKLTQTGSQIDKTIGRVPLASKQIGIASPVYTDVTDPVLHRHVAEDFSPAPSIKLRATAAAASDVRLYVRLVKVAEDGTVTLVPDGLVTFSSTQPISKETLALSLDDQATYKLQAQVLPISQMSATPPSPGTGNLHSAELLISQTDSSGHGIGMTVGWYPGVTTGTTVSSNVFLDHLFRAPANGVEESSAVWHVGVKSLTPGGSVGADLWQRQPDALLEEGGTTTSTSFIDLDVPVDLSSGAQPTRDTKSVVSSGASGRLARTLMRMVMRLRDIAPPIIEEVVPTAEGNSVYSSQPLLARATDGLGSGVAPSTIVFTLKNLTNPSAPNVFFSGSDVIYDAATQWAKTTNASLSPDNLYEVQVDVEDNVGNAARRIWRFLRMPDPQIGSPSVSLRGSGLDTGQPGATPGTTRWTINPELHIDRSSIGFDEGSLHPGFGVASTSVDLTDATLVVTVDGVEQTFPPRPYASGTTRVIHGQFSYTSTSLAPRSIRTPGQRVWLSELSVDLPDDVTFVRITLPNAAVGQMTIGGLCADPSASPSGCGPDPLRFYMSTDMAEGIEEAVQDAWEASQPDVPYPTAQLPADLRFDFWRLVPEYIPPIEFMGGVWSKMLSSSVETLCGDEPIHPSLDTLCWVGGVGYGSTFGLIPPSDFASYCTAVYHCNSGAGSASNSDLKHRCINKNNGKDQVTGDRDECEQLNVIAIPDVAKNPIYYWQNSSCPGGCSERLQGSYRFTTFNRTDWGFADAWPDGQEELGLHFASRWEKDNQSTPNDPDDRVVVYGRWVQTLMPDNGSALKRDSAVWDLYPEESPGMPAEPARNAWIECGQKAPIEDSWTVTQSTGDSSYHGNPPIGIATGRSNTSSDNPNDHGYPQWATRSCVVQGEQLTWYKRFLMTDIAGYFEQHDAGSTTRTDGFMNASFGHLKYRYERQWTLEGPLSIGPDGFGFIGLDFEPERVEYEEAYQFEAYNSFSYRSNY